MEKRKTQNVGDILYAKAPEIHRGQGEGGGLTDMARRQENGSPKGESPSISRDIFFQQSTQRHGRGVGTTIERRNRRTGISKK